MPQAQKKILCVDDDADDRLFLTTAIKDIDPTFIVIEAENGLAAMEYLNRSKTKTEALPCLIILDMNMPFLNGKQTLEKIKNDRILENIPVVIFTSSANPNDRKHFIDYGADFYTKPNDLKFMSQFASSMLARC